MTETSLEGFQKTMDVGETHTEQQKQPEQGTREAALWLAQMADRAMKGAHADLLAAVAADPVNALWLSAGAQSYLTGAQVHALLYIGDQVKALVELHRETVAQGARMAGDLVPQLAKLLEQVLMPPRILIDDEPIDDAEAARLRKLWADTSGEVRSVPATVDVDPSAELRHLVGGSWQLAPEVVGALLRRYDQRGSDEHPAGPYRDQPWCACDTICRAITLATRPGGGE